MIRIGIVGAGTAGWVHSKFLRRLHGVEIAAVCDPHPGRLADLARKRHAKAYARWEDMLAREALDGICNCTPDAVHAAVALAAIRRGIPVLSEKPMAATVAEARRMDAAARKSGGIAMLNFTYRSSGALRQAAKWIRAGRLGRILHVEAACLQSWLVSDYWGSWRAPGAVWKLSTRQGNQGVLGDLGCHLLDFVTQLCGDLATIDCRLKRFDKGVPNERVRGVPLDAPDSLAATLEFASGALGVLHASRWATGHKNTLRVTVHGDRGALSIDAVEAPHTLQIISGARNLKLARWRTKACRPGPLPFAEFVSAIRAGVPRAPGFSEGLRNQLMLAACTRSSRLRRPVAVAAQPPRVGL